MTEYIYIPFPKDLYDKIIIRSGGRMNPVYLAADQVNTFVEMNKFDDDFWTEEGIELFGEEEESKDLVRFGRTDLGYLFCPAWT